MAAIGSEAVIATDPVGNGRYGVGSGQAAFRSRLRNCSRSVVGWPPGKW